MNSNFMHEIIRMRQEMLRKIDAVEVSVKRIALQPAIQKITSSESSSADSPRFSVKLCKNPRNLYILWHEFEFVVEGTKPAKFFTPRERGVNKFSYSRRKIFWDLIVALTRRGLTSDAAIDKVYQVYGRGQTVSNILLTMREDRKKGGNPAFGL